MIGCTYSTFCGSEVEWDQRPVEDATISGVFPLLINRGAFVDKLVLAIPYVLELHLSRWETTRDRTKPTKRIKAATRIRSH